MSIKSKTYWGNPFTSLYLLGGGLTGEKLNLTLRLKCKGLLALEIFLSFETIVKHLLPASLTLHI